jgi:serine/threonine-protein kinase RsbW
MGLVIRRIIKSELSELQYNLKQMEETLSKAIPNKEAFFNVRLILNELVCNGSIHGNNLDPNKEVKVCVLVNKNEVIIEVTDQGTGFDTIPSSCEEKNLEYNDHGRGLVLVNGLSDKFEVEDNTVRAVKYM